MIRNGETAMGRQQLPENDVAALLPIHLVTESTKNRDGLAAGDAGQRTHTATSITSSWIDGGIGSSRSRKLSM
jgi:hypothetical protein